MRQGNWAKLGVPVLVLAAVAASGCSDSGSMSVSAGTGRVRMVMGGPVAAAGAVSAATLDDGRRIDSATIALSSVLARNMDGELVDVSIDLPVDVDLVDLLQGRTVELPIGSLPVATYDQLVVVIRSLEVVLSDGTDIDVTPPGGGWTAIVRTEPFEVVEGQVTTVNLRFRPERAFRFIEGRLEFQPEFDGQVE
jgi:hypothetical protein